MNIIKVFSKNKIILIFILILINSLLQSLVFPYYNDFYHRLLITSTSLITIIFNLGIILLFINELIHLESNCNYLLRQKSLKDIIHKTIKIIIKFVTSIYLITMLLTVIGAFLGSSNNIFNDFHPTYNIKISSYLIYYYVKQICIYILISTNMYFISILFKERKIRYILIILIIGLSFIFLNPITCSSYFIEIVINIIYIMLLLLMTIILYKFINYSIKRSYHFEVINYLFKKYFWKLFSVYILFYIILYYLNIKNNNCIGFFQLIGYYFLNGNFLGLIWTLFQVYLIIYFLTSYLSFEEDNNSEYIILRESFQMFFLKKIFFIYICICLFRLLILIISSLNKCSLLFILKYIFYDFILLTILIGIIVIGYYITHKNISK